MPGSGSLFVFIFFYHYIHNGNFQLVLSIVWLLTGYPLDDVPWCSSPEDSNRGTYVATYLGTGDIILKIISQPFLGYVWRSSVLQEHVWLWSQSRTWPLCLASQYHWPWCLMERSVVAWHDMTLFAYNPRIIRDNMSSMCITRGISARSVQSHLSFLLFACPF